MKKDTKYINLKYTDTNLIPSTGEPTGSYSCTWWNQSSAASALGYSGEALSPWRDSLNQEALFDREDLFHHVPREYRSSLIFLLDDGWDVPVGTAGNDKDRSYFGSVDPDSEKFSRYGSTPEERLCAISAKVKEMGYAGLGLWISPQKSTLKEYDKVNDREYWETRAKWCDKAGVLYWKVDWGNHDYDDGYRLLISECAHKYAKNLLVEHSVVQKPCTHNNYSDSFLVERTARMKLQMTFCDVNRTYDVIEPFEEVCTLQRAHEGFMSKDEPCLFGRGLINAENLYAIAASLGCTVGIMNYNEDAAACINWQKLSPPFGIRESEYLHSEERLCDTFFFDSEVCEWAPCKGLTVEESAPAIMARNCPLPEVSPIGQHAPFVTASKNPKTGAYSVATSRRTIDPVRTAFYLADVTLKEVDPNAPIGVFGVFNTLTLELCSPVSKSCRVLLQDLTSDKAIDVTEFANLCENKIVLDGKDLRILGKIARGHNNRSAPSLLIKIV
ncbi:MAG: hypothetical protein IJF69_00870 [Clostridia bacterium]|nr:hypothetical protein [Clostridia bacterium]